MTLDEYGLMKSDRSRATQARYEKDMENGATIGLLREPSIVDHDHWRLIVNRYPYDERWCTSMMLVHKGESRWDDLDDEAVIELHKLKNYYKIPFDKIEENGEELASVTNVPHIHLLQGLKK